MHKSLANTPQSPHTSPNSLDSTPQNPTRQDSASTPLTTHAKAQLESLQHEHNLRTITDYAHRGIYLHKPALPNAPESTPQSPLLNLTSNDYLGLADASYAIISQPNPQHTSSATPDDFALKLAQRFWEFIEREGIGEQDLRFGSGSSRLLSGGSPVWEAFEAHLQACFAPKSALLFNSGYHLNCSCLAALARVESTLILIDEYAHASMFDGLLLGKSLNPALRFKRFKHNNIAHVSALLESSHKDFAHIIIVSEALFSMEGDLCDLAGLVALKRAYPNALLYLDEAHSLGVVSELGLAHSMNYAAEVDFLVLTFGKALGSVGACMLCARPLRELFVNLARGLIYSTALPPINIAFSYFAFTLLGELEPKREKIRALSQHTRAQLTSIARALCLPEQGVLGELQIISLVLGANKRAIACEKALESSGIFAKAIKSPTIPRGSARIRLCLHANLPDLAPLFDALESYANRL